MNDRDQEQFETELRKLAPARLPEGLMARLMPAQAAPSPGRHFSSRVEPGGTGWRLFRWLAPAMIGAAVVALLLWRWAGPAGQAGHVAAKPERRTHDVEIDRQLVAAFDTVARMPDGAPVRFRCREWADQVVLRDTVRGVVVEQDVPRLEVVPVGFEIY